MKWLLVLFVLLIAVLNSTSINAQEMGAMRKSLNLNFSEKIQSPLGEPLPAGTYTIGSGGYFPTIDSAFNKLSIDGISGEVVLELIDNFYTAPTNDLGFFLNGPISGAGPNSRVTIKPAANKNVTIEGSGKAVLSLLNSSYMTFDGIGLNGSTTLTINSIQNTQYSWNDGIRFVDNSDQNVIQNIILICEDYTRFGGGITFITELNLAPDGNLIKDNFIKKARIAISITSYSAAGKPDNNIIRGNFIGSESDSLINRGVHLQNCQNTIVENNIIQNVKCTSTVGENANIGINSYWGSGDIIRNNIVHGIKNSTGFSSTGISLSGAAGNVGTNNSIYNNMIYDIQSTSSANDSRVTGIQMWNQNNPKIYYNTVYLYGNGTNPLGSAALYMVWGSNTNVEAKNNIFINTRNESPYCASAIYLQGSPSALTSDNNDLYYEPNSNNCLIRAGGVDYMTLQEWQATGKDLESITEMPNFTTPYLHIDKTFPTSLERGATPIAGITTDFDGDLRNATTPDIGADEFNGFTFEDPLPAGTYTIGTGGNFSTIQDAFDKLNTDGIAGEVGLVLIDSLYTAPSDAFGFKLVGPISGAGPSSRINLTNNHINRIEGNGGAVLTFDNMSYLTLYRGIMSSFTIRAISNNAFSSNDAINFIGNSDQNIVSRLFIENEDYQRGGIGISFKATDAQNAPDSNLIEDNFINKAGYAIVIAGYSQYGSTRPTGNVISRNMIGSETDSLIAWGIQSQRSKQTIIENNVVQNVRNYFNFVCPGINAFGDIESIIRNNVVHNIYESSGTEYGVHGISLTGSPVWIGVNNLVYNNMVYDIRSTAPQTDKEIAGIKIWCQTNPGIYFNTINLEGTGPGINSSAALYIRHSCTDVNILNNILVNRRNDAPMCASSIYVEPGSTVSADNNDLYYEPSQYNCLVRADSVDYLTLQDWRVTGNDLHSINEMPNFVGPNDLHIVDNILTLLDGGATPIAGIELDIDGDERNVSIPDIGADEFDIVGVEDEKTLPTEYSLEQNYPNPFNPSTKISWQSPVGSQQIIKVYDVLGNEIATLVDEYKPAGKYEVEFSAALLPSGVYFYQLKAGEFVRTRKMILIK